MNRKINHSVFLALNEIIHFPFLILDHEGNIISGNKEAKSLFLIEGENPNIFANLSAETNSILNDLIEYSYENKTSKTEVMNLIHKEGAVFNARITLNTYKEDDEVYVFILIHPHENKIEISGFTKVEVKSSDFNSVIKNDEIRKTIEEIRSLYPFTYIGKEKILATINRFNELFWIKDVSGKFVIVNNKMAGALGLKFSQIEGKHTDSFIQPFIADFTNSIDQYIRDSINCLVIEGVPVSGIITEDYQTIMIPLTDSDENLIAIIGIGQKINNQDNISQSRPGNKSNINLIAALPRAIAIVDINGILEHYSQEFCKLFASNAKDLRGELYSKILPASISDKIGKFVNSESLSEKFDSDIANKEKNDTVKKFAIFLDKIIDNRNDYSGLSILVEDFYVDQNFENLINRRGRMFEILIQNNPEPMFIYDAENLRFIEVNDAALSLYGYRKDEFLQMDLTDLYTPEDIQTLLDSSSISAKEGKFTGPFKHKKKDGSFIFVEISKISFKYNDVNAHFNIIRDVTERLDLEKKNQLFRTAFENTGDLLFITDNVGIINFVNNPVKNILGYPREDLSATSFSALVRNEERGTLNSSIFQSYLKETVTLIMELKKSDGSFVETELTAVPVLDYKNEVESFSIIAKVQSIAAEKPEEKVKEIIKEVVKEVIVEKPFPAETNFPAGNNINFFSSLFHEILTPINVILGFVQEFTENKENLTPEQKEASEIINQNRDRLLNTMNSVIEYSNIEKGNADITPEEISITEVIDKVFNEYKEIVGSREVEFAYGKISSSLKFITDKQKFQSLISLLVKISAYINKEKKIYFSAYPYEQKYFVISIKDNYSFVSKYFLESLTGIFNRTEESQIKDFGISKLTIRLTQSLLELLNGRLEILEQGPDKVDYAFVFPVDLSEVQLSKKNEGQSEISEEQEIQGEQPIPAEAVEPVDQLSAVIQEESSDDNENESIPAAEEVTEQFESDITAQNFDEQPADEEHYEPEPDSEFVAGSAVEPEEDKTVPGKTTEQVKPLSKSMRTLNMNSLSCLYIEDQVDSQILFKVQMRELHDIKFAVSFEEALPLLDNNHFDFIVMDINLQGEYNGLDALRIIHRMPGYETMPIIAVTAYVLPGDKDKFIATGFNDFISKPIFREKMIDSLERIFLMQT